jgi:hypothetical protein
LMAALGCPLDAATRLPARNRRRLLPHAVTLVVGAWAAHVRRPANRVLDERGLAKLAVACGWELDAAVMATSRLIRAVVPPFVAVPVMALGFHWSGGRRQALAGCAAVALMTVASAPVMRGISMDKTSVGLVWMATAACASALAMSRPRLGGWSVLLASVALSAMTHVGAFGVTAIMVGIAVGHGAWQNRVRNSHSHWWVGAAVLATAALLVAALAYVEPRRAVALLQAPFAFFLSGVTTPFQLDQTGQTLAAVVAAVTAIGCHRAWRDRAAVPPADLATVFAAVVTAALLLIPKNVAYMNRLLLMAPVPAAVIAIFLIARRSMADRSRWPIRALVAVAVVMAAASPFQAPDSLLDGEAGNELRSLRSLIPNPESTLVVAPHGLEWFAGFFPYTPVRLGGYGPINAERPPEGTVGRYRRVLLLRLHSRTPSRSAPESAGPSDSNLRPLHVGRYFDLLEFTPPRSFPWLFWSWPGHARSS